MCVYVCILKVTNAILIILFYPIYDFDPLVFEHVISFKLDELDLLMRHYHFW